MCLIHGPPGTGKTTTLVELIRQAVDMGLKVLACAPSNVAVDNMLERLAAKAVQTTGGESDGEEGDGVAGGGRAVYTRSRGTYIDGGQTDSGRGGRLDLLRLGHPARVTKGVLKHCLDARVQQHEGTAIVADVKRDLKRLMKDIKTTKDKEAKRELRFEQRALRREVREREQAVVNRLIYGADVVLTTTVGAASGTLFHAFGANNPNVPAERQDCPFDLVIIDEVAQATEASCWIPILLGERCILGGDHKQLPPTIKSDKAAREGLGITLADRLVRVDSQFRMLGVRGQRLDWVERVEPGHVCMKPFCTPCVCRLVLWVLIDSRWDLM